jgi:site-specific DNA-methyltransferase (adenine-specific)
MITYIHGDCLEKMKDLSDNSVDCFVCDLPYGCLTGGGTSGLMRSEPGREHIPRCDNINVNGCAWDVKLNLEEFWTQVKRLARNDHTPVLMFCTTKFGYELIKSNEKWFRYDLVWDKQRGVSFLSANKMPMRSHEMIYVFSKKGAYYKRVDIVDEIFKKYNRGTKPILSNVYSSPTGTVIDGKNIIIPKNPIGGDGKRCALSVVPIAGKTRRGGHPTEKPKELYRWLLERYCPEGGTILDPTAGSFSSCIVAQEMGLNAIGIEKDEVFYKKANPPEDIISHIE